MRFQILILGFKGLSSSGRKAVSCKKVCAFNNIGILVDVA